MLVGGIASSVSILDKISPLGKTSASFSQYLLHTPQQGFLCYNLFSTYSWIYPVQVCLWTVRNCLPAHSSFIVALILSFSFIALFLGDIEREWLALDESSARLGADKLTLFVDQGVAYEH